jgi:hypothetical protein
MVASSLDNEVVHYIIIYKLLHFVSTRDGNQNNHGLGLVSIHRNVVPRGYLFKARCSIKHVLNRQVQFSGNIYSNVLSGVGAG